MLRLRKGMVPLGVYATRAEAEQAAQDEPDLEALQELFYTEDRRAGAILQSVGQESAFV
jgi:hypothetical protein